MGKPTKRFSYLLLEEGEFYIQDWMAVSRFGSFGLEARNGQHRRIRGRLRLCSKSIFFEPDNIILPIIMFPFNKLIKIEGGPEPLMSPSPANSKWSRKQEGFMLGTTVFVKMKEGGYDMPYAFEKQESEWWFSLEFASVQQFLTQAQSLLSINSLPVSERDMVLSNSMAQKEAQGRFDSTRLIDLNEQIVLDCPAAQVMPLVREPGRLVLTQIHLYFQPLHNLNNDSPVRAQPLSTIITVAKRRHSLRHIGLEIFFTDLDLVSKSILGSGLSDGGSAFFTFRTVEERDAALAEILKQIEGLANKATSVGSLLEADNPWLEGIMRAWQEGDISNYDYLIYLNLAAGRSFCDLTQWPVLPWILRDYTSHDLDLNNSNTFRDLSKPIGALNVERLSIYKERYAQMVEEGGPDLPFLYGTHYSTPGYVLYWLVRSAPAHMLRLQNGRFDAPDRLFVSVADSWDSVNNNPADLKELIPEFFSHHGDFFLMREGLNLGIRQGGDVVSDVKLPPWCKTPEDFIKKHREALECEHVSKNLHLWIDLIFGFKQRGEAALDANNVFHYLTYEGSVDLEAIVDPVQRASLEAQINEFGQAPQQLFVKPHPERLVGQSKLSKHMTFDTNLHREVFRGLNSQFLLQIMATTPYQINKSVDISSDKSIDVPSFRAQVILSPGSSCIDTEEVFGDGTSTSGRFPLNSESTAARLQSAETAENQTFLRLSSAKTIEDQRFVRMSSTQSDCSIWDNWSPASNCGMEFKETGHESIEGFHLERGLENSLLLSRRLATENLETSFGNLLTENATLDVVSDAEARSSRGICSPYALMFKERLSLLQALKPHRGPLTAVILSEENFSKSLTLYSAGQDGFVKVFSVPENCQVRATRLGALPLSALALVKSSDKYPLVLAGSNDNCLYAYSVDYDRPVGKMQAHEDTITSIRYVDGLQRLLTASSDATIKIWTMEEGRGAWTTSLSMTPTACVPDTQFLEHEGAVLSLDVQESSNIVVSGDEDGGVIAWDMQNPCTGIWQQRGILGGPLVGIRFIPNRPQLVVTSGEGTTHLLDVRKSGSIVATYDCKQALKCIETSGETILVGSANGDLFVCHADFDNGGSTENTLLLGGSSLQGHGAAINSISMLRSRNEASCHLATASDDGHIHLYNSSVQQLLKSSSSEPTHEKLALL